MQFRYTILITIISFLTGFLFAKNHIDFQLLPFLEKISKSIKDYKYVFEIIYFSMASLIIPIAYFQYRNEKKKEKKGDIQFAHKIFREYSEDILLKEEKFTQDFLKNLSLNGDRKNLYEFNKMLNRLDTIAAAFVHNIADRNAGKRMMGKTYCEQIQNYLPAIKRISGENYKLGLENIFKLWDIWKENNG